MDVRDRFTAFVRTLPTAHRVGIVAALVILLMASVVFGRWIMTPTYTLLYSGMDDAAVAGVVQQLDGLGVPYRLEGSRISVPQDRLYATRAALAAEGVAGKTTPPGYEILDEQGLSISDFRQKVDYQRAVEGELAKTLMAMEGVNQATVHLALPEEELFSERQKPATASVLVGTTRTLAESEVEAITFLVSSSVEGLEATNITVADAKGAVLHAPGDAAGSSAVTNRNLRQTREYEQALATDLGNLLTRVTDGTPASVVVRAAMNYDESETQTETFGPESQVALREQTSQEDYEGTGGIPGGLVGVDGGPLAGGEGGESTYAREEVLREYGVDKVVGRTVAAPGRVERLSVAIVMDDGSQTGAAIPPVAQIEDLARAALGLDTERGDAIAVTMLALPAPEDLAAPEEESTGLVDRIPEAVAVLVLLIVSVALFLMSRRRKAAPAPAPVEPAAPLPAPTQVIEPPASLPAPEPPNMLQREVADLVQRQPEEIATLLRGWLADRRSA